MGYENEGTKIKKARREKLLLDFIEKIKTDGTWTKWVNNNNALDNAKVCESLLVVEKEILNEDIPAWDLSFFKGTGWGKEIKNKFNTWVLERLAERTDHDLFRHPLTKLHLNLPAWLEPFELPKEVWTFLEEQAKIVKRQDGKISELEHQLKLKETKILKQQAELESMSESWRTQDEHYLSSVRTLRYE